MIQEAFLPGGSRTAEIPGASRAAVFPLAPLVDRDVTPGHPSPAPGHPGPRRGTRSAVAGQPLPAASSAALAAQLLGQIPAPAWPRSAPSGSGCCKRHSTPWTRSTEKSWFCGNSQFTNAEVARELGLQESAASKRYIRELRKPKSRCANVSLAGRGFLQTELAGDLGVGEFLGNAGGLGLAVDGSMASRASCSRRCRWARIAATLGRVSRPKSWAAGPPRRPPARACPATPARDRRHGPGCPGAGDERAGAPCRSASGARGTPAARAAPGTSAGPGRPGGTSPGSRPTGRPALQPLVHASSATIRHRDRNAAQKSRPRPPDHRGRAHPRGAGSSAGSVSRMMLVPIME